MKMNDAQEMRLIKESIKMKAMLYKRECKEKRKRESKGRHSNNA